MINNNQSKIVLEGKVFSSIKTLFLYASISSSYPTIVKVFTKTLVWESQKDHNQSQNTQKKVNGKILLREPVKNYLADFVP